MIINLLYKGLNLKFIGYVWPKVEYKIHCYCNNKYTKKNCIEILKKFTLIKT